jgi:sterol desaturase/sphingolipid hydroxylase (fatty acid hydroxylase superfamily)
LLVILGLVFIPLERLFGRDPVPLVRPGIATDLVYYCAAGMVVGPAVLGAIFVVGHPLRQLLDPIASRLDGLPTVGRAALSLAITLVAGYWGHRLAHRVPVLWRFHAVHHAMTELDWLTAVRSHPLDTAFVSAMYAVPLYGLGLQAAASGALIGQMLFFLGFIQHANIRVRLRGLRWVIPNPEWHAWHHTDQPDAWNRNYSVFPFIDVMFRTHYLPRDGRRPGGYGCPEPVPSTGFLAQVFWPFTNTEAQPPMAARASTGQSLTMPSMPVESADAIRSSTWTQQ